MKILLSIAFLILISMTGFAQEYPRLEVFGGYSYLRTENESIDLNQFGGTGTASQKGANLNGFSTSIVFNPHPVVGIVTDVGGYFGGINYLINSGGTTTAFKANTGIYTFLFGPQFHLRGEGGKNTVFLHPMAGLALARQSISGVTSTNTENSFAAAIGGGFDRRVADQVQIRVVQLDYLLTRFNQGVGSRTQSNLRVSTGFTFGLK